MRKISLALITVFFLFACATPVKYDKKLNALVGQHKADLIQEFGKPSAAKILGDGDEIITYTKANNVYVPSEFYLYNQSYEPSEDVIYSPFLGNYDFTPYGENFGYEVEYICQTSFMIQDNIVTGWKWRGNDCVSY